MDISGCQSVRGSLFSFVGFGAVRACCLLACILLSILSGSILLAQDTKASASTAADKPTTEADVMSAAAAGPSAEASAEVKSQAETHWKRAFPNKGVQWFETPNFLVAGAMDKSALEVHGQRAETIWAQWQRAISSRASSKPPSSSAQPQKLVIFVVSRPYELNEFALMVEERWLPRPLDTAFWKSEGKYAYVVVMASADETLSASPLGRALAGASLARSGRYPLWFERGMADAFSARVTPDHPRVAKIQAKQAALIQLLTKPNDFRTGAASLEVADAAACSFVQFLQRERGPFQQLLQAEASTSAEWEKKLAALYRAPIDQVVDRWWQQLGDSKRRRKAG